ncbi:hypothetical protein B0T25DRAFT_551957 [Lasiosphaeria hispida]|uniref:Uncharacterized protein n=1 Tax=Lasiosphaeria hispida TaxID=260671 RepID=A0AAJ0HB88_9PEZI|nr:hypothetical protein B0T25DRAFT_551957 [Lasiosphaeria hispida]
MYRQLLLLIAPLAALVNGQHVPRQPAMTHAAHVAREPVITPAADIGRRSVDLDGVFSVTPSFSGCSAQSQFGSCAAYDANECDKEGDTYEEKIPCYCRGQTKLYECFTSYCPKTGEYYDVIKSGYDGCNGVFATATATATSGSSSGSGSGSGSGGGSGGGSGSSSGSSSKPNAAPASRVGLGAGLMLWGFWATFGAGAFVAMIVM